MIYQNSKKKIGANCTEVPSPEGSGWLSSLSSPSPGLGELQAQMKRTGDISLCLEKAIFG